MKKLCLRFAVLGVFATSTLYVNVHARQVVDSVEFRGAVRDLVHEEIFIAGRVLDALENCVNEREIEEAKLDCEKMWMLQQRLHDNARRFVEAKVGQLLLRIAIADVLSITGIATSQLLWFFLGPRSTTKVLFHQHYGNDTEYLKAIRSLEEPSGLSDVTDSVSAHLWNSSMNRLKAMSQNRPNSLERFVSSVYQSVNRLGGVELVLETYNKWPLLVPETIDRYQASGDSILFPIPRTGRRMSYEGGPRAVAAELTGLLTGRSTSDGFPAVYEYTVGTSGSNPKAPFSYESLRHQAPMWVLTYLLGVTGGQALLARYCRLRDTVLTMLFKPESPSMGFLVKYTGIRPFIDADVRRNIDALFLQYWKSPTAEHLDTLKRVLDVASGLPLTTWNSRPGDLNLEELEKYHPETREEIELISFSLSLKDATPKRKFPYYFKGEPGTGKTYEVEQLAKTLDLPLIRLNLEGGVTDIVGKSVDDDDATAGRFMETLAQSSMKSGRQGAYKNCIILIDEFDKLLRSTSNNSEETLSFMLKLCDPDNLSFVNDFLGTTISLKDSIIILVGNYDLRERALVDRFNVVEFLGFTKEGKKSMVCKDILPGLLKSYNVSERDINLEELYKRIYQFIDCNDTDPGLRSLLKYCEGLLVRFLWQKSVSTRVDKLTQVSPSVRPISAT